MLHTIQLPQLVHQLRLLPQRVPQHLVLVVRVLLHQHPALPQQPVHPVAHQLRLLPQPVRQQPVLVHQRQQPVPVHQRLPQAQVQQVLLSDRIFLWQIHISQYLEDYIQVRRLIQLILLLGMNISIRQQIVFVDGVVAIGYVYK